MSHDSNKTINMAAHISVKESRILNYHGKNKNRNMQGRKRLKQDNTF
jgi:hypothetical protein